MSIFAFFCLALYAWADSVIVTKTIIGGHESVVREYTQGKNFRTEDLDSLGNGRSVTIFSFDRRAMYRLDEQTKQVVEMPGPDVLATFAAWITRPPRIMQSGKTVNIYFETVDTGERRQQFGFTIRHLLIHERHVPEAGACSANFEIDRDGWYLIPSHPGPTGMTYMLAHDGGCRDTIVKHGWSGYPGFPVQEVTTTRYPAFSSTDTREVIAFSTEPLDKSLFEIPKGFKRVEEVSWTEHLAYDYAALERAAASWF